MDAAPAGQRERLRARLDVWTATATANGSVAVTSARTAGGTDKHFGGGVVAYRDSAGVGEVDEGQRDRRTKSEPDHSNLEADSAVVVASVDWNAVDGASRTWRSVNGSAATGSSCTGAAPRITRPTRAGRGTRAPPGRKTLGLSAPSGQKYATVAVEVKGSTAAPPTAEFTFSPTSPVTGEQVSFNSTGACAATPCTYTWEDDGPDGPGGTQWPLGSGETLQYTFSDAGVKKVRLTVTDGISRPATVQHDVTVSEAPARPPLGQPSAPAWRGDGDHPGAGPIGRSSAGNNVRATTVVGDVNLDDLTSSTVRHLGTSGIGSIGQVHISGSSRITIRARTCAVVIRGGSSLITVEQSRIGGSARQPRPRPADLHAGRHVRRDDQVNDIGWTRPTTAATPATAAAVTATDSDFSFVGNKVHDIAADGFQGVGGENVLIDRNEIGPVGRNPGSDEHSDNIQITGNGANLRITNNWIHHQGYYNGRPRQRRLDLHPRRRAAPDLENNLIEPPGPDRDLRPRHRRHPRSNITVRRNTWVDGGQAFARSPASSGTATRYGQRVERNVAGRPGRRLRSSVGRGERSPTTSGASPSARHPRRRRQLHLGQLQPAGEEPIGYRKPRGVHW